MQSILNQAKNDPAALQNHMQNATIRMKIQKVSIFSNPPYRGHRLTMMKANRGGCNPTRALRMSALDYSRSSCILMQKGFVRLTSSLHAFSAMKG
jgi:hypothetical protein